MKYQHLKNTFLALIILLSNNIAHGSESLDAELLKAIQFNKLAAFKTLLKQGANPNAIFGDASYQWVMCEAMREDRLEYLKEALKYGADVNLRNRTKGVSDSDSAPILCSFMQNKVSYTKTLELLIENNVDIDISNCEHCQPFGGNKEINSGPNSKFSTPIMRAAGLFHWKAVNRILDYKISLGQGFRWQEKNYLIWKIETARSRAHTSSVNAERAAVTSKLRKLGFTLNPGVGREKSQIQLPNWGEPAVF